MSSTLGAVVVVYAVVAATLPGGAFAGSSSGSIAAASFELVSVTTEGRAGNGASFLSFVTGGRRHVSDDGRLVVFESAADDLVPNDTNGEVDVFVHDRVLHKTLRVNTTNDGTQAVCHTVDCQLGEHAEISGDGRYVVFASDADNLRDEGDPRKGHVDSDVYLKDIVTGKLTPLSACDITFEEDDCPDDGIHPTISGDGSTVAFVHGREGALYTYDIADGTHRQITSENTIREGAPLNSCEEKTQPGTRCLYEVAEPRLDHDGDAVALLGAPWPKSRFEESNPIYAYLIEPVAGVTPSPQIVSSSGFATRPPLEASDVAISGDGKIVAFSSDIDDIEDGDRFGFSDVFIHDLTNGVTEWANVQVATNENLTSPSLSHDGRFVAFSAFGPVYVYDRMFAVTNKVTDSTEIAGDGHPSLTSDGCLVAFTSGADLVEADGNRWDDVYVTGNHRLPRDCTRARVHGTVYDGIRGRGKPVNGAKVELRQGGDVVHGPIATEDPPVLDSEEGPGYYEFEGVSPGDYRLRVTLEDESSDPGVIDVRYGDAASEPAWVEVEITVEPRATELRRDVGFRFERFAAVTGDLCPGRDPVGCGKVHLLHDLAVLFRGTMDYVNWVRSELPSARLSSPQYPLPVEMYAFSRRAGISNAFYRSSTTEIRVSRNLSLLSRRDGRGLDPGPTVEWHEFTHHLFRTNVPGATTPCPGSNHRGYLNPSTCDSLNEGLAAFLPTVAFNDIVRKRPNKLGFYDAFFGVALESNALDAWGKVPIRFEGLQGTIEREEFAVAALLWDLIDGGREFDTDSIPVVRPGLTTVDRFPVGDGVEIELATLWSAIRSMSEPTIGELWDKLHSSSDVPAAYKKRDVDLFGHKIDLLDIPFLMHGFYPLYPPDTALKIGNLARDYGDVHSALGRTDMRDPNDGSTIRSRTFTPHVPGAALRLSVEDPQGGRVSGAVAHITLEYPEGTQSTDVLLDADGTTDIYIEPPAYYTPSLDEADLEGRSAEQEEELPDCSASDYQATITIDVSLAGTTSKESVDLDNCSYLQEVAENTDDIVLKQTLTIPRVATKTIVTARKRGRKIIASGLLTPGKPGGKMVIELQKKKKGRRWRTASVVRARLSALLDANDDGTFESRFRSALKRTRKGKCRVVATWKGDSGLKASRDATRAFLC